MFWQSELYLWYLMPIRQHLSAAGSQCKLGMGKWRVPSGLALPTYNLYSCFSMFILYELKQLYFSNICIYFIIVTYKNVSLTKLLCLMWLLSFFLLSSLWLSSTEESFWYVKELLFTKECIELFLLLESPSKILKCDSNSNSYNLLS